MIKAENLSIKINNKSILKNCSFSIKPKSKIILSGHSGCGKSVLISSMLGFNPLESGNIIINDLKLNKKNKTLIRNLISYFPQNPFLPKGKIKNIFDRIFSLEINKKIALKNDTLNNLLNDFFLTDSILNSSFENLSGGEKQRIFFILIYLLDRDILILDEPTSALDHNLKIKLLEYLNKINKTIILISHDKELQLCKNFETLELKWVQKR